MFSLFIAAAKFTNWLSYKRLKFKILNRRKWDLNICCGKTDGGGVNADIFKHADLPNFILINDIYNLPFEYKQFDYILCSHTIEHVEDPDLFLRELQRVGNHVKIVIPPLWDFTAAFNLLEHRWLFLTFKKEHQTLPFRIPLGVIDFLKHKFRFVFFKA